MTKRLHLSVVVSVLSFLCVVSTRAGDWPQWRGPHFNGSTSERNLPEKFSPTENVAWVSPMPGPSGATPVVWGDTVVIASTDETTRTCVALAFDRKTGKELWRVKAAEGMSKDRQSTYSNASPLTDGKHIWFFYGTGDLLCLDFAGKEVWRRNIQKDYGQFAFLWTFSSTPLLYEGKLYLQVLQRDTAVQGRGWTDRPNESYLLALDPATGKELWKVIRPAQAREESLEAFTSPVPHTHAGVTELLVAGGDCISGHDPKTGKEIWRWGTWNPTRIGHWRLVPSPAAGNGVVLACGPKDAPIYAVKLGQKGELPNSGLAWQSYVQQTEDASKAAPSLDNRDVSSDVPTPAFHDGRFYILNGNKRRLISLDPVTGKVFWSGDVKGKAKFEASPTVADGKIYMMNHAGEVFVVRAGGNEFDLIHTASMGEPGENFLRACVVPSHGQLFIRTSKNLYCIGKK